MGVAVFLVLFCLIMLIIIIKCSSKPKNKYRINNDIIQESSELGSAEMTSNHLYGESNENNFPIVDSNLALEATETNFGGYSMVRTEEPQVLDKSSELYKVLHGSEDNNNGAKYINSIIGSKSRDNENMTSDNVAELVEEPLPGDEEDIYDIVYSEPIEPQLFTKHDQPSTKDSSRSEVDIEYSDCYEESLYAPIYTGSPLTGKTLELKPDNIRKIKVLGAGFFGKVVLADTVGLSLKDLKMSDTEDDKSISVRVAVKQLKQNMKSSSKREAFDKEVKFMSCLNHPNVLRMLGVCMLDTPFIMMEYMGKGDLNQYLQELDSIIPGNSPPTNFTISTGTLTKMSTQIANAMKYLAAHPSRSCYPQLPCRNRLPDKDS